MGSLVVNTDLKAFVPTRTAASSTPDNNNTTRLAGWSTAEIVFLSFLLFFLVASLSLISLYIRLDHRHKSRSRQPADMYHDEARDASNLSKETMTTKKKKKRPKKPEDHDTRAWTPCNVPWPKKKINSSATTGSVRNKKPGKGGSKKTSKKK